MNNVCYLDSQDYSTLTDPRLDTPDRRRIKDALLELAKSNKVMFVFSATAVCEVVALSPDATKLAEAKAELLSELCGSNALVSFDRLVQAEVHALENRSVEMMNMLDPHGRWFPEIPVTDRQNSRWDGVQEFAENELRTMGLSRQQRRAAVRKFVKDGEPRAAYKKHLNQQSPKDFAKKIIEQYPMRPDYAEVMSRYALGRASEIEFNEALMNSLSDPSWMMKWFTTEHAISSPISDVVRKPGRELGKLMRSLVDISKTWAGLLRDADGKNNPLAKNGQIEKQWQTTQDQQLLNIVQRIAGNEKLNLGNFSVADVDRFCPGLSAGVRSLYSSMWENVGGSRKESPSDSQPVDALHAFYAPYVKIFRADRFMAPHIEKQVRRHGTIVVPRLTQLLSVLENLPKA